MLDATPTSPNASHPSFLAALSGSRHTVEPAHGGAWTPGHGFKQLYKFNVLSPSREWVAAVGGSTLDEAEVRLQVVVGALDSLLDGGSH